MIGPNELKATDSDENEVLQSKIFDHLGLVAGMFEELEIGDRIDEQIAQDFEKRNISVGQAVKTLVLTGLGFVQQRLYLTAQFFEKMPTDRLVGEEVRPEHLNNDVLGERSMISMTAASRSFFGTWRPARRRSSVWNHGLPTWTRPASRSRASTTRMGALTSLPKTVLFASRRGIQETIAQT